MRTTRRIGFLLALVAASAFVASATPLDQSLLPVQADFGCLACHNGPSVTSTSVPAAQADQLTGFGQDWLAYGSGWGPDLAAANSDGDGCSNGYELGNPSGDWSPEDGYLVLAPGEVRNPGESGDCLLPIGDQSFGVLKGLFGRD